MSIDSTIDRAQVVGRLQCVIAIVVVSWVFKVQAALDVVPINILIDAHILAVVDLLKEKEKGLAVVTASSAEWQRASKCNK